MLLVGLGVIGWICSLELLVGFLVRSIRLIGDVLVGGVLWMGLLLVGWLDALQRVGGLNELGLGWLVFGQWDCYSGMFDGGCGGGDGGRGLCAIGCGGLWLAVRASYAASWKKKRKKEEEEDEEEEK